MKIIKSITKCYNKLSNFGKILLFVALLLVIIVWFKSLSPVQEGMVDSSKFLFKQGTAVYDDFYANVYNYLVFNQLRNDYEVGQIINSTTPNEKSVIADIGCGTGHSVKVLNSKHLQIIGVDISPSMIEKAKSDNPRLASQFVVGNGLNGHLFRDNSLTHILCLYFTVYYMENKMLFFNNCMNWLMPGGYLIVHLVDKYTFNPILPPSNPLYIVSPQKYTKERITKTKITFNDFIYNSNFKLDDNIATFDEKFKFNDGRVRKHEHKLYMEDLPTIVNMAQDAGFTIHAKIDMVHCSYENQYLYVFVKP
jgi:ubiquinone/menaquinone biosynthesis C-methylase UbiE